MELKLMATVFGTVFLAELGDKTQLVTLLFAAKAEYGLLAIFMLHQPLWWPPRPLVY